MSAEPAWRYRRILLKLSGEAFMGEDGGAISPQFAAELGREIKSLVDQGIQVGMVIGGGNIFRGVNLAATGINRVTADQMGMLATVMNGLAMKDVFGKLGCPCHVMTAFVMPQLADVYRADLARQYLAQGSVVIFSAGTGNPFFTTDTGAVLRGVEIEADLLLKATKVDGVYSADPVKVPEAIRYDRLTFDQVLQQDLKVMDTAAILLCRDHGLPIRVFNMNKKGALRSILMGEDEGTLVATSGATGGVENKRG